MSKSSDDLTAEFEKFLRALSPADAEKIHKELMLSIEDDKEEAKEFHRRRTKGLRLKDVMVFTITVTQTCLTCGRVVISETMSSDLKPIVLETVLCGMCEEVLKGKSVEELVCIIIKKEQVYCGRKYVDYKPNWCPPILTPTQIKRQEEDENDNSTESGTSERVLPETLQNVGDGEYNEDSVSEGTGQLDEDLE